MGEIPVEIAATITHSMTAKVALLTSLIPLYEEGTNGEEALEKIEKWKVELAEASAVLDWLGDQLKV